MKNSFKLAFVLISIGLTACVSIPQPELVEQEILNPKSEGVVRYSTYRDGRVLENWKDQADKLSSNYCQSPVEKVSIKKTQVIVPAWFFGDLNVFPMEEVRFKCKK